MPSRMNLGTASADSLEHLAQTCDAATFGRDDEDVLDESYRKAGKLDIPNFAVGLGVETNGLMDVVRGQLLEGREAQQSIYAELYKLNVYGETLIIRFCWLILILHRWIRRRVLLQGSCRHSTGRNNVWLPRGHLPNSARRWLPHLPRWPK